MNNSIYRQEFSTCIAGFAALCLLMAMNPGHAMGQNAGSQRRESIEVETHFAAAQQAQRNQDYATAEREYLAVLAIEPTFSEVHMNLGLLYQLQDRIPEAMTEFRHALNLKPTLTGANFLLGIDYCQSGDGAAAVPYLKAATRAEPKRVESWTWLATAYEMSGDIHSEVATLRNAVDLQLESLDLLYLLGHAFERLGKEEVKGLQKVAPGTARAEQLLAESYANSSQWPSAVIHFQNAVTSSPDIPGVRIEFGEVLLREGKVKRAAEQFEEELRKFPTSLRALVRRGEVSLVLGDVTKALSDWDQALKTDATRAEKILGIRETGLGEAAFEQLPPDLRENVQRLAPVIKTQNTEVAHFAMAFLEMQSGNSSAAGEEAAHIGETGTSSSSNACSEPELRQALKKERFTDVKRCGKRVLTPVSPTDFRFLVAGALFESGDYQGSLEILSKLPAAARHSAEAAYWRARCYEKLATAAYLRLYEMDPDSYRMHQLFGDLAATRNDDGKAIEEYRAAMAMKPSLPNLHYSLGHVLWKDLKVNEAREEFEAELKLNPRHPGALNELGDTYLLEHQPEKALPFLERALEMDAANPDIHRDLGTAYSEQHKFERAAAEFSIAVADDHDGSVHYKLARAYQSLGEKEKAAHEFAISTALNQQSHARLEKQTERMNEIEEWVRQP